MRTTCGIWLFFLLVLVTFRSWSASEVRIDHDFSAVTLLNTLSDTGINNREDVYCEVKLVNTLRETKTVYLSIINPTLDKITIRDGQDTKVLGDLIPFTLRTFKHINHVYPVELAPGEQRTLQVKVSKQRRAIHFRIEVAEENTFIKSTNHDNFFIGIFYGICFMFILLLFCFYIFSKSRFFTLYLLINLFAVLIFFHYSGTGYQFGWFFSKNIQQYISFFAITGYIIMHMTFILQFFSYQIKSNFNEIILRILLTFFVVMALLFVGEFIGQPTGLLPPNLYDYLIKGLFLLYAVAVIAICIFSYIESRRREIVWVFCGFLLHIANWLIFINSQYGMANWLNQLSMFQLFTSNIFIPQINYYITIAEFFLITVFISINYHNLIRQNNLSSKRLDLLQKININTFVMGQEEEREKITELIDSTVASDIQQLKQSLLRFNQQYEGKKMVPIVLNEIDKTLEDIDNITSNYVAPDMQQIKLEELITTAMDRLFTHIQVQYDFTRIPPDYQLNANANINLYRILQEISNNIMKHSGAENVEVTAIKDAKTLQIKIVDDGVGFVQNKANKGIGLLNIESRMNSLHGNAYFLSNEKNGSSIHLIMPVKDIS